MSNLQLTTWASIAEIFSGVAVVIALIFLVIEIRQNNSIIQQNTAAARWSAVQTQNQSVQEVIALLSADEATVELMRRAHRSYDDLSDNEKGRCRLLNSMVFLNLDLLWYSYRDGILPEPLWAREAAYINFLAGKSSCGRATWTDAYVSQPFREYVNNHILKKS